MKKVSNKIALIIIKQNAIKARVNSMLPYYLVYLIRNIDEGTDVAVVNSLKVLTEQLLRVKGFYARHKDIEEDTNNQLKKLFAVKDNKVIALEQ